MADDTTQGDPTAHAKEAVPDARLSPDGALAAARAAYATMPRRVRDVLYGKLAERTDILAMLDLASKESAARFSADPAFLAQNGGHPIERDPIFDHVMDLIEFVAHVPDHDRVAVPDRYGVHLVSLTAVERAHFGRAETVTVDPESTPGDV